MGDLFHNSTFMEHDNFVWSKGVTDALDLLHATLLQYVKKHWSPHREKPPHHEMVFITYLIVNGRHLTNWLYRGITNQTRISQNVLSNKCNEDLGTDMMYGDWSRSLAYPLRIPRNAKFNFIQYIFLQRAYLTLHRLQHIFPATQHCCPRCKI